MKITLRSKAIELGLSRYYTGSPCQHGHLSERYTCSRVCIKCKQITASLPENKKKGRLHKAQYIKENKDHVTNTRKLWESKNKEKTCFYSAGRRASKLQATPSWADKILIQSIYEQSTNSDDQMHVDHVLPLQGTIICGLHVETNLQIISATDNLMKHNNIDQDVESIFQLELTNRMILNNS